MAALGRHPRLSVTFTATIRDIATATTNTITMTWDGSTFVRR